MLKDLLDEHQTASQPQPSAAVPSPAIQTPIESDIQFAYDMLQVEVGPPTFACRFLVRGVVAGCRRLGRCATPCSALSALTVLVSFW